jgi:hypothetical protein
MGGSRLPPDAAASTCAESTLRGLNLVLPEFYCEVSRKEIRKKNFHWEFSEGGECAPVPVRIIEKGWPVIGS